MISFNKSLDDFMYEASHNVTKPYFKGLRNKFLRGRFKGNTYLNVWTFFPDHIEWLILNRGLVIDAEEFEKVHTKRINSNTTLGKLLNNELVSDGVSIDDTILQEPYKSFVEQLPLEKYSLSNEVSEKLKLYIELIQFNRKKNLIREEWKNYQDKRLPIINGIHQFTEEIKEKLLNTLTKRGGGFEINKISSALDLLGITITDIDYTIQSFNKNPFNKYSESFFMFLYSCIYYGCGEYYHETRIQFDKETLQSIKKKEISEIVVPKRLPNYVRLPDKEILNIDNELFFIKNTSRNAKRDGVNYGKIYSISEYRKPDIACNWFDFNSQIETRVDILLSVECSTRSI